MVMTVDIIDTNLMNRVMVKVSLKKPNAKKVAIVNPSDKENFIKALLYNGLFLKFKGSYIPVFYLKDGVSVVIRHPVEDIVIGGGIDSIPMYDKRLVQEAMGSINDVSITVKDASLYELYMVKEFLDMITPPKSSVREKYMVKLYKEFREIQSVVNYEKLGDGVTVFYLTNNNIIIEHDKYHTKLLEGFARIFRDYNYNEKLEFIDMMNKLYSFSTSKRAIVDERDGLPLVSIDDVEWTDLAEQSDLIISIYNDENVLANIEDAVIVYSGRNSEYNVLVNRAKYLYTIKLKNVKKVYKNGRMYLVSVKGDLKYRILNDVVEKIDEIDLVRTQLYSVQEKFHTMKRVATVKMMNLLSSLFDE